MTFMNDPVSKIAEEIVKQKEQMIFNALKHFQIPVEEYHRVQLIRHKKEEILMIDKKPVVLFREPEFVEKDGVYKYVFRHKELYKNA